MPPLATEPAARSHPQPPIRRWPVGATLAGLPATDFSAFLLTVLVWSSLHPIAKRTLAEITPLQLPFSRVALASLFLLGVCATTGRIGGLLVLFRPRTLWKVVFLGATGFSLSSGLSMIALSYLPAGVNSVLANASPLMVALGVMVLLRERLPSQMLAGLLVGFAGVAVIALRGGVNSSGLNPIGIVLSLVSSATWALYTVMARRLSAGQDVIAMSAATSLVGALPLGAAVAVEGEFGRLVGASLTAHLLLLWCGIVATGATFTMWVLLLRRIDAARVSSFQYLIPLCALALAYPIAGEVPTPVALGGAAMIVGGVAIANTVRLSPRPDRGG